MLCCVGLIGGMAVGQYLGGPWIVIAPAAGFGIGLVADMKFMKGMHGHGSQQHHDMGRRAGSGAELVSGTEVDQDGPQLQAERAARPRIDANQESLETVLEMPKSVAGKS